MRKTLSVLLSLLLVILTLPAQAHEGSHTVLEMMAKGDEYLANGDLSKSLMCYDISNKLEPDNVDVMLRFVAAYQLEGDNDAALEWASKAIYIDPASGDAYVARYLLLMELERYEEAWLDMQYAVICGAAVAEKQYADIAKALTSIGHYETAYDAFSNAGGVALSSDYADTYRTCLVRTGNREKALSLGLIKTNERDEALQLAFETNAAFSLEPENIDILGCPVYASSRCLQESESLTKSVSKYLNNADSDNALRCLGTFSDIIAQEVTPEAALSIEPKSVSPDGNTIIFLINGSYLLAYQNGNLTVLLPSISRSVTDDSNNLALFGTNLGRLLSEAEGLSWSSDGRFISFSPGMFSLMRAQYLGLLIADTKTGEYYLAKTAPKKMFRENGSGVINTSFDDTGTNIFFTTYGNELDYRTSLYQYDMNTGASNMLINYEYPIARPALQRDSYGQYSCLSDTTRVSENVGIHVFSSVDNHWVDRLISYPVSMQFAYGMDYRLSQASGYGIIQTQVRALQNESGTAQYQYMTIIDSNNEYTGIDDAILFPINDPNQAERVPVEDFSAFITQTAEQKRHDEQTLPIVLQSYYTLANATLSSDGQYALVLLQNGEDQYCYKLMDLTTLQLRTVNVPTDLLSAMQAYHSVSSSYMRGFEWFDSNRLIFATEGGTTVYRLVYRSDNNAAR